MSKVRSDSYTNRAGDGAPTFPYGSVVTGIQTATSFKGAGTELTGTANNLTVATAQGLSGTPSISVNAVTASGNISGVDGTFSGNISATGNLDVGGTITYEDMTNQDVIGLSTFRAGIKVTTGGVEIDGGGLAVDAGISTFKGAYFNGTNVIKEKCNVVAGKLSDNPNIDLENGMIHLFTTQDTGICTPDLRMNASTTLNSVMNIGDTIVVTLMSTAAAAAFSAQVTIDTAAVTEKWIGGSAPTGGGSSGIDTYSYTITKLSNTPTWNVIANLTNAA